MNIRPTNNVFTNSYAAGEPAGFNPPTRAQQLQSVLNKIARKYPNLDRDLAKALVTEKEIENSDTWEGLKWYEVIVAPMAIKGNKIMKKAHHEKVEKLQNLVATRDAFQAELARL